MNEEQSTPARIAKSLRNLVAAIHLDATGQTYEGQYEVEIQALTEVLVDIGTLHEMYYHGE